MKQADVDLLKEGARIVLKDGDIAYYERNMRKQIRDYEHDMAYIEVTVVCPDTDHCKRADNSDGGYHPCYGHKQWVWPAQIVRKANL